MKLSQKEKEVIQGLTLRGWAVILWTPKELDGVDPIALEDSSIAHGWDFITMNRPTPKALKGGKKP